MHFSSHFHTLAVAVVSCAVALMAPVFADAQLSLTPIGTYTTGLFNEGAAEIPDFDPASQRLFVVNGGDETIDILDLSDPTDPTLWGTIEIGSLFSNNKIAASPNSVAISAGVVAVAVERKIDDKHIAGIAAFFDAAGSLLGWVEIGFLPDMVTFTPDGKKALFANEGEPNQSYKSDPEGSVSIVDVQGLLNGKGLKPGDVKQANFKAFNNAKADLIAAGIRIFGPNATVAQDLEPEYIVVSADSSTAYVTLQENNAVAVVDIATAKVLEILPLGVKDFSLAGNGLDASDRDSAISITNWPVLGFYMPDALARFEAGGTNYLVTANEGDARDYDAFSEEARVSRLLLDLTAFPNATNLQKNAQIGRLTVTTANGDTDGDGDYDKLYTFGGRSFSIWRVEANGSLTQVFDSGDALEQITADAFPDYFNSTNDENDTFDNRSDNKGPEPEGVTVGEIQGVTYAFIGLERIGGIVIYDLTNPLAPEFVTYVNNRDFSGDAEAGTAGDLGPEGLVFIPASESPNGEPLLVVANEVSGSTTIYQITVSP
jgi:hypothetical protein